MQRYNLMPQQIIPGGYTRRDPKGDFPLIGDEAVDAPGLVRGGEAVLVDLEPFETCDGGLQCVGDFRPIPRAPHQSQSKRCKRKEEGGRRKEEGRKEGRTHKYEITGP